MRFCKRCVFPDTKPDLFIDSEGVCALCRTEEKKQFIDWDQRERELRLILNKHRSKDGTNYDCIVPVSGGKDSHFQVYMIKEKYGLNPLGVCFEPTLPTLLGRKNLENLNEIGIDILHIKRNPIVYRKLVIAGLKIVGDNEWPNHVGIFTTPFQVAVKYKIPLLIWGENQTEFGKPERGNLSKIFNRRWLEEMGGLLENRVEDMMTNLGLSNKEMLPYIFPSDNEMRRTGTKGIFLGYFVKWNTRKQLKIVKGIGFKTKSTHIEGTYTNFENLDCYSMTVHDYLKFIKYGFGRCTDHACLDIRLGLISRDRGISLVEKYDGQFPEESIDRFLMYIGMSLEEFFHTIDPFVNKMIFEIDKNGSPKRHQDGNLIMRQEVLESRRSNGV